MVSELFRKVQDGYIQQRELGWRGKGLRQQPSTAASHFLQSLSELTTRLERYQHTDHTGCHTAVITNAEGSLIPSTTWHVSTCYVNQLSMVLTQCDQNCQWKNLIRKRRLLNSSYYFLYLVCSVLLIQPNVTSQRCYFTACVYNQTAVVCGE